MNKLWITIALLTTSPHLGASDIILGEQRITPISFKSTNGYVKTIDIAASDSIGIVYRKVVKAFGWSSHSAICCRCHRTYIPLMLDITNNFLELLKLLSHDEQYLVVKPYTNIAHAISVY